MNKHSRFYTLALGGLLAWNVSARTLPEVAIDDTQVFPESLTAAADGTLFTGSWKGVVYRASPHEVHAKPWITPSAENGLLSILGVLADDRRGVLWVCSVPAPTREPPAPGVTALMAFDLKSGAQKLKLPFPDPRGVCNDITLAKDGTAYISDTPNGRIFRIRPQNTELEVFAQNPEWHGIDGIAFAADGLRLLKGNRFLLAENAGGTIDELVVSGNKAMVKILKEGLQTPTSAIRVGSTIYAVERKFDYVRKPELRGQDPGAFTILTLSSP